ncbi:hypothetical protein ACWCPS_35780 [Streptomyces mauvecolor]|uniref:hypothetical protein n=1 Tax=Streptomyces sp. HUAS TT7 TaxID=3447507 RepID=UPI003F655966
MPAPFGSIDPVDHGEQRAPTTGFAVPGPRPADAPPPSLMSELYGPPRATGDMWAVTLPTRSSDGRPGIHHFVTESTGADIAVKRVLQEAMTDRARAHRRDASLLTDALVVARWQE